MTGQVVEFVRALREAGVPVSLAESLDACEALRHVCAEDRAEFRLALQAALVKDVRDVPTFERLFDHFFRWHLPARKRRQAQHKTRRHSGTAPRPSQDQPGRPAAAGPKPSSPGEATPRREKAAVHRPDRRSTEGEDPQADAAPHEAAARLLDDMREGMAEARREAVRRARRERQDLWRLDLNRRLTPEENRATASEVERLASRLVSRQSLRLRRARRGKVDLKATLARSVRTGGVPFQIARRRRTIARHQLLLLCDVSGSVRNVAPFLLRLVHRMQTQFARTHSFLFVDRPVDVTGLFQRHPLDEALSRLYDLVDLNLNAYSDFGNTFYEILDDWRHLLNRDTVVLILGDARTNEFDPMEWTVDEIRQRARRVIWLNPEPPDRWNTHDSAMGRYAPFCDTVLPCGNLEQLAEAASALLRA